MTLCDRSKFLKNTKYAIHKLVTIVCIYEFSDLFIVCFYLNKFS